MTCSVPNMSISYKICLSQVNLYVTFPVRLSRSFHLLMEAKAWIWYPLSGQIARVVAQAPCILERILVSEEEPKEDRGRTPFCVFKCTIGTERAWTLESGRITIESWFQHSLTSSVTSGKLFTLKRALVDSSTEWE